MVFYNFDIEQPLIIIGDFIIWGYIESVIILNLRVKYKFNLKGPFIFKIYIFFTN